ncbi:hypothetical protein GCM10011491_19070 [Brucella endophytica]|uniref:Uncharacterized protein n=1 Tax=Brucella endophytica TaxID=1963359 RepID=A0A916WEM4_9HYPH|nr:hypothetical protein [Brucella endophytica]GGA91249.1 hypothetical protein GCM10011491_19070 [Brucella endophytica]
MLSPNEFTVGTFASATPLSLILPRVKYEETVLVGHIDSVAMAVFLSGSYAFDFFESANENWGGLIIPNVRIEVDETDLFNPDQTGASLGTVIRKDTRLIIRARRERFSGPSTEITLHDGLASAEELRAGFNKWQVVIGEGLSKRVLWRTPENLT